MNLRIVYGLYSFVLIFVTMLMCKYFTDLGINDFYMTINIPQATPQNHYFTLAWNFLYFLLFISFLIILNSKKTDNQFNDANALFVMQLFLQIVWTFSFFYMEQIVASAIVIVLLDMVVALMLHTFFYINKWGFILLIPYLLWLIFASYLNIYIAVIN